MNPRVSIHFALLVARLSLTAQAAHPIEETPAERRMTAGSLSLGAEASEGRTSGYLDLIAPFWTAGDALVFVDARTKVADDSESLGAYGVGLRYLVPGPEVIVGASLFYDTIASRHRHGFEQVGLGVEVLTRCLDMRANWYLNDGDVFVVDRFERTESERQTNFVVQKGGLIRLKSSRSVGGGPPREVPRFQRLADVHQQRVLEVRRRTAYKTYEGALEGYDIEAGFLVPGLGSGIELRILGGYYSLSGPFGRKFEGIKGRLEARILSGLFVGAEYWDDANVMGGHWTGGVRMTLPFSIFELAQGRNPFAGAGEILQPTQRGFRERMTEMVQRSHHIRTTDSEPRASGTTTTLTETLTAGAPLLPK